MYKRQDSKTKAIEHTNQRKTCKAIWGKSTQRTTTSHHIGDKKPLVNQSIKQRTAPATSQIKVELIGILASCYYISQELLAESVTSFDSIDSGGLIMQR